MKICFYAPFKPLSHPDPSGDQSIGAGLFDFMARRGHHLETVSTLRCRWIYWKPWRLPEMLRERHQALRKVDGFEPHLWLTYHSYYKAPDILGPGLCRKRGLPYVIFQGAFATQRKRRLKTLPGYLLNTRALRAAAHVFTNKRIDLKNLARILPPDRRTYVAPGISTESFRFSETAHREMRRSWGLGSEPAILSAAMFRSDVKTEGLALVIRACGQLAESGRRFVLVIAGDGKEKKYLMHLADTHLPGRVRFVGKIPHHRMYRFYSAGDLFVFPGIRESLGMVFLEAQSCGLPVVAFDNAGTPEVIRHGETGLLVPAFNLEGFVHAVGSLLDFPRLRNHMGRRAEAHVRKRHDINRNYRTVEQVLEGIAHDA